MPQGRIHNGTYMCVGSSSSSRAWRPVIAAGVRLARRGAANKQVCAVICGNNSEFTHEFVYLTDVSWWPYSNRDKNVRWKWDWATKLQIFLWLRRMHLLVHKPYRDWSNWRETSAVVLPPESLPNVVEQVVVEKATG